MKILDFADVIFQGQFPVRGVVFSMWGIPDSKHGEVVTLLLSTCIGLHLIRHVRDDFLRRAVSALIQRLHHPLQAKLPAIRVSGFCQSIGIEKDGGAFADDRLLYLILEIIKQSCRQIGFYRQRIDSVGTHNDRSVVAGIAETQTSRWEIEHTNE